MPAEDADVTLRLWMILKPRLAADGMTGVYERLERPLLPVFAPQWKSAAFRWIARSCPNCRALSRKAWLD